MTSRVLSSDRRSPRCAGAPLGCHRGNGWSTSQRTVGVRFDVTVLSMAIMLDASGQMVAGPFDPADRTALDAAIATIEVRRSPQAETADSQPVKLLP